MAVQLHREGHIEDADALYRSVLEVDPDQPDALHFRGVLCHRLGRGQEASELIGRAVALVPDHPDAHNNLGNVLLDLGRSDEALAAYEKAVGLDPEHAEAHHNRAHALRKLGRLAEALASYRRAVALRPDFTAAHRDLARALADAGQAREAAEVHVRLADTLKSRGQLDTALESYRRAIALHPDHSMAHHDLARTLAYAGRDQEAAEAYREWLAVQPGHPIALHLLAAATGEEVPVRASDDYVRVAFDRFAGSFDKALHGLGYRAPDLVAAALAAEFPEADESLDLLDAGCGTGLCAPLLRPCARRLVGVDLSPRMIDKARGTGMYDELAIAELTAFLENAFEEYDAIISADTLVYFGDLGPVFAAASRALRPGRRLIFTTERAGDAEAPSGYRIHAHGRYSHTEPYLRRTLEAAGLVMVSAAVEALRKEGEREVTGNLIVARKAVG